MPSAGIAVCGSVSRLAVGNPSARPRCWPRTTTPSTRCGRPRSRAAAATSPAASSSLIPLEEIRHAVVGQQRHALGGEVVLLAELGQQRDVARGLVPEPEILPHHHPGRVQPVHQHGPDELVRPQLGELAGERQHADRVHAQPGQQLRAPPGRAQNGGWEPGRTTSSGCGSKVTTTTGSPSSAATSAARPTMR